MVKKVRGLAISTGVTVAFLIGLALVAKKTNVGDFFQSSLRGFGSNVGEALTNPFQGLLEGLTSGGSGLGESAVNLSEGFQKSVSSTLGGGFNVFSEFGNEVTNTDGNAITELFNKVASTLNTQERNLSSLNEALTGTTDNQSVLDRILQVSNPIPSSPSTGFYYVTFANGKRRGPLALSQATIDFYRNSGATVTPA